MRCMKCGNEMAQGSKFCIKCGTPVAEQRVQQSRQITPQRNMEINQQQQADREQMMPDYRRDLDYKPLGMWSYFGYDILFSIPVIGWIFLIAFACGASNNINLRNYARSKFCLIIVLLVILVVLGLIAGETGGILALLLNR